jgi:galactokinase
VLQARAVHVFSEAARVLRFRNLCIGGDYPDVKILALGGLMRMSHESCKDKFECSSPELEDLIACAKRANSLGSRLTGAGWGGCTVHLVQDSEVRSEQLESLAHSTMPTSCLARHSRLSR